jgi:hypothetical protein
LRKRPDVIAINARFQELQVAGDHQQQIVEVMGNAARELADGFHFLGLRQAALALPQCHLDMLAVAQIMDHSGEIAPPLRFEFAHRQVDRKCPSILVPTAHSSANANDLLDTGLKVVANVPVVLSPVRVRHQNVDILSDEFRGAIAEQALGRRIDAFDQAPIIDRNDGNDGRLQDAPKLSGLSFG